MSAPFGYLRNLDSNVAHIISDWTQDFVLLACGITVRRVVQGEMVFGQYVYIKEIVGGKPYSPKLCGRCGR